MLDEEDTKQSMTVTVTMSHLESYVLEKLMSMPVRNKLVAYCEGFFGPKVTEDEIVQAWETISEKIETAMQEVW